MKIEISNRSWASITLLHRCSRRCNHKSRLGVRDYIQRDKKIDLQSVGGPKYGWIHDGQFYEIDIASNNVLFSWSALDHLNLSDSMAPLCGSEYNQSNTWDFAHLNSVMRYENDYILSSHGYCSIYAIDSKGDIKWTLNVCLFAYNHSGSDKDHRGERAVTSSWP